MHCLCSFQVQGLALATIMITLFFMIKYSRATNFLGLAVHITKTYGLGCLHVCTSTEDMRGTTIVINMEINSGSR